MKNQLDQQPQVTVICITYNHENYIEQALQSIVSQQTSFPFIVFVGDDCSTDKTREIIDEFVQRFPNQVFAFYRETNVGGGKNWQDLLSKAHTPYVAFCDGDDFWTDPNKLQKQFDYLEAHTKLRACFHDVEIHDESVGGTWFQRKDFSHTKDGKLRWPSGNIRFFKKKTYRLVNYIPFGFVHTSSMFIRWDYTIGFPDWIRGHGFSDYPMWCIQVNTGKFGYLDEVMSVYRRTGSTDFDFVSRYDFWAKSKTGSIEIDEGLINFFTVTKPARRIVKALQTRERDDLAKLIKGTQETESPEKLADILESQKSRINNVLRVSLPTTITVSNIKPTMNLLAKKLPLPPYNASIGARIKRLKDVAVTAFRTYW